MGGCLESRCVGRVYGADGAVLHQACISHNFMRKMHGQTTLKFPQNVLYALILT